MIDVSTAELWRKREWLSGIYHPMRHIIDIVLDKSVPAIDCTDTDNQTDSDQ